MIELPSESFTFGNYSADIPFTIYSNKEKLIEWLLDHNIIGYSFTPSYRYRDGEVAVLIELEDGGEYWNHISMDVFEELQGILKST